MSRQTLRDLLVDALADRQWHTLNELFKRLHVAITPEVAVRRYGRDRKVTVETAGVPLSVMVEIGKRRVIWNQVPAYVDGTNLVMRGKGDEREIRLAGDPEQVRFLGWGKEKNRKLSG